MKVIFFGTPEFAARILRFLLDNHVDVVAVITKPDRPQGRSQKLVPTPVKQVALEYDLPVLQPPVVSAPDFAPELQAYQADLFVVVAYGEIIKQHLLDMPTLGAINVHASLLPKYRGAAPIQRCLIEGATESGVTIMKMVLKMDAGDMIKKVTVPITLDTTYGELENALCLAAQEPLLEVIRIYAMGQQPPCEPQDHTLATLAPKIELEACKIDWQKSALEIHNLIRGVNPEPGAWCYVKIMDDLLRFKIFRSLPCEAPPSDVPKSPGAVLQAWNKKLIVACGDGTLELFEVQQEGKRRMSAADYIQGLNKSDILLL